jgi:hypothetical protein
VKMPFGKFRGCDIDGLPDDYIEWLATRDLYGVFADAVLDELDRREDLRRRRKSDAEHDGPAVIHVDRADLPLVAEIVDRGFKGCARVHHPDQGGDAETMRRLNAIARALRRQLERIAS